MTTEEEWLACQPITRRLIDLGVSTVQMGGIRLRPDDTHFASWVVRSPGDIPNAAIPLLKEYATWSWLLLDNPPWSRERDEAWSYVTQRAADDLTKLGMTTVEKQRSRARKPRGKLDDGRTMSERVRALATRPGHQEASAQDLWPHLYAWLDELDLDPEEVFKPGQVGVAAYKYDFKNERKAISFRRFANILSEIRKESRSRLPGNR